MIPTSWIDIAPDSDWSLQNLPFGIFSSPDNARPRPGVAIGEYVLDLEALADVGLFSGSILGKTHALRNQTTLNEFIEVGSPAWAEARAMLTRLLTASEGALRDSGAARAACLTPLAEADMHLPLRVPNYTDFYASREHATNVGIMFRGKANALQPNWLHLPVGYHGRASSVVVSGTDVRRPWGQVLDGQTGAPRWQPSAKVDYELELGFVMGAGNELGSPMPLATAAAGIFGYVLLNDWSARDVQAWEYVPLGPFTSKNWATSISPWIVPSAALEPFAVAAPPQDPLPPAYLRGGAGCNYDVSLRVGVAAGGRAEVDPVTATSMRTLYWTPAQMAAHHTVTGCNLMPGDLMGTGTISSEGEMGAGCLLEGTWNGTRPVTLRSAGVQRTWLEDGDTVVITGHCQGEGYRVGFGECRGTLLPALELAL